MVDEEESAVRLVEQYLGSEKRFCRKISVEIIGGEPQSSQPPRRRVVVYMYADRSQRPATIIHDRDALKSTHTTCTMLAWLLHVVLSTLFAIYITLRKLFNAAYNRLSSVVNYHHRSPDRYVKDKHVSYIL